MNRQYSYRIVLAVFGALLTVSATSIASGQGAGRETPKPNPTNKPPATKPSTPTRKPTSSRQSARAFRPQNPHIELVRISPGSFMMGSNDGGADEKPVHQVTINYSFYMGKYEVTQKQWQSVMGSNPSHFKECGGNCPVEQVSWNDAQDFIMKLNQMNNAYIYRLPSEAEWEYACRAGTTGDFAGNLSEMAWYAENAGFKTHAVGGKKPNTWRLFDMHGSVEEWCQDWFHETYSGAPADGSTWLTGGVQEWRVFRGGSAPYFTVRPVSSYLRSASRNAGPPDLREGDEAIGLRVVAIVRTQ